MTAALANVSKRFGRHVALRDATLSFASSSITGIVGPNGAGKTTLLRILARILEPSAGEVRFSEPMPIRYFAGERTLPPAVSASAWAALWSRDLARHTTSRRFGVLSRGTRQRIGLDATLADAAPSLLLLDEPWEGLDPDASRWLSAMLTARRAAGSIVVVSSHRVHDLAAICDRCEFMVNGRVAAESIPCGSGLSSDERAARVFTAFDQARGGQ